MVVDIVDKKITAAKISFVKSIGEISEKKIEMVTEMFGKEYPMINNIPEGIVFSKTINNNLLKSFLIASNQITYSQDGENIDLGFDNVKSVVKKIYDKLYVSYSKCIGTYAFACLIDAKDYPNTLKDRISLEIESIRGIGAKIFLDNENYSAEFSFEPYIRDFSKYFCSLNLQCKKQSDVNQIVEYGKNEISVLFDNLIKNAYIKFAMNKDKE